MAERRGAITPGGGEGSGRADDGAPPWLATAYVPGMALDQAVAAHGPWPVASVRALGAGLAEALEAIHGAGLIHRDLKPSNVLIAPDGPRVVDFGISGVAEATVLTRAGTAVGTPGYMAPEQLKGDAVTAATDVFALGAVLTYAATGTGPFGTGSAQSLNFRIAYEPPRLDGLPGRGLQMVARCLAKDQRQRPDGATLVRELSDTAHESGYTPTEIVTDTVAWAAVVRVPPGSRRAARSGAGSAALVSPAAMLYAAWGCGWPGVEGWGPGAGRALELSGPHVSRASLAGDGVAAGATARHRRVVGLAGRDLLHGRAEYRELRDAGGVALPVHRLSPSRRGPVPVLIDGRQLYRPSRCPPGRSVGRATCA